MEEPCDRPSQTREQICILYGDDALACESPANILRRGLMVRYQHGGFQVVAGVAPAGTKRIDVRVRDIVVPLKPVGRVYAGSVKARPGERVHVRLR